MPQPPAWQAELRVALLHALWIPFVAWLSGSFAWGVAAASVSYAISHLRHAYLLNRWLERSKSGYPPDGVGIWAQILRRQSERQREHRARKQRLAQMVLRIQRSTRAIPDALVVLNEEREIQWTNKAAEALLGVSTPRDGGQRVEFFIRHPDFSDFLNARVPGVFTLRSPVQPSQHLELRLFTIAETNSLLIAQDATDRVKIEQMRKDFVADVSHELRTPLTVLSGYLENMTRDPDALPDMWRRPVLAMSEQLGRMRHIVEDLLLIARMEGGPVGEPEVVDVAGMVASLANDGIELSGARGHRITFEADSSVRLSGVQPELNTAFWNLVGNAVQYTPDGGSIELRWFADERGACFEVRDSGEGIDADHIPRLTERFFRVDRGRSRERGGTGLGLCIVKHIMERHNAMLEIESTLGKGSVFRCVFAPPQVVTDVVPISAAAES